MWVGKPTPFTGWVTALLLLVSGGTAQAQLAACQQIEAQLARLDSSPTSRFGQAAQAQRVEIAKMIDQNRRMACGTINEAPQCAASLVQVQRMQANLRQLEAQARREGGPDTAQQRAALLAAYTANRCRDAAQQAQAQRQQQAAQAQQQSQGGGGFFSFLFGNSPPRQQAPQPQAQSSGIFTSIFGSGNDPNQPQLIDDDQPKTIGGIRAVCVKLCDGSFFPVSATVSTVRASEYDDACSRQCPGTPTEVFYMRGDDIANATSQSSGRAYMKLANALKFKQTFDKSCSCRPPGVNWADLIDRNSDPTIRPGDIVVSERQSMLMSLPAEARKAAELQLREQDKTRREDDRLARRIPDRLERGSRKTSGTTVSLDGEPVDVVAQPEPAPAVLPVAADPAPREETIPARPVRIIGDGRIGPQTASPVSDKTGSLPTQ